MRPLPATDGLVAIIRALLGNATALLEDAELLYDHQRYPRAYALAALGWEELGKVYLCLDVLLTRDVDPKSFWKLWREHGDKLASARAYAAAFVDDLDQLDVERLSAEARQVGRRKLECLYVDFDGVRPLNPERVGQGEAAQMLSSVRRSVGHAKRSLGTLTLEALSAIEAFTPELIALVEQVEVPDDPQQTLSALRQLIARAPNMTPEELAVLLRSE